MYILRKFAAKVIAIIRRYIGAHELSAQETAELYRASLYYLGKNVELHNPKIGTEPYLISIHDNVTCASGVVFVTHDVSCFNIARFLHKPESDFDKVGSIELFENCFVGAECMLLPNTSVGKNSIVAARSVVTKHIPDNEVWGGSPARYIMSIEEYAKKIEDQSNQYPWMPRRINGKTSSEIIRKRQEYFFNPYNSKV